MSSFFIDRDAARNDAAVAGQKSVDKLVEEIAALRMLIEQRFLTEVQR